MQTWDFWYPKAAATGLPFARCKINDTAQLLVHSAPPIINITVRNEQGSIVVEGKDLRATQDTPMARISLRGGNLIREDVWPGEDDLGSVVVLPGGEAGILKQWWNAADLSEWRWQVEFYNRRSRPG